MPNFVKHNLKTLYKAIRVCCKSHFYFLGSKISGHYDFNYQDMKLFIHEQLWKVPMIVIVSNNEDLVEIQIKNLKIFWPAAFRPSQLPWIYNEVFGDRTKNQSSYDHPMATIPKNGWVMDAGAAEGFFCHYAFLKGADKIIAIEPVAELQDALYHTFDNKKRAKRFVVERVGLGNKTGLMCFDFDPENPCSATATKRLTNKVVPLKTIDELIAKHNLAGKGFIKMDIEGAEMDALKGARNTLEELKPALAIAVYHEYQNAKKCAGIIRNARPDYQLEFRGMYCWNGARPRPCLLYAW